MSNDFDIKLKELLSEASFTPDQITAGFRELDRALCESLNNCTPEEYFKLTAPFTGWFPVDFSSEAAQ